jgi:hypothetical protein
MNGVSSTRNSWWLLLILLLVSGPSWAAGTPTLVQKAIGFTDNGQAATPNYMELNFDNPAIAGDSFIIVVRTNDTPATNVTVSDNKTDTYTQPAGSCEVTGTGLSGRTICIFYANNLTAGAQNVLVAFSTGGNLNDVTGYEYNNLSATVDKTGAANQTSGTAASCSAMTTTINGDLIFGSVWVTSYGTTPTGWTTYTPSGSFIPLAQDGGSFTADEYEIQGTLGTITPSWTTATAVTNANSVCIAIEANTSGGTPSGLHKNGTQFMNTMGYANFPVSGTTMANQFPFFGNFPVIVVQSASIAGMPTGLTDSLGNTWASLAQSTSSTNQVTLQAWYTTGTFTSGDDLVTFTFASTGNLPSTSAPLSVRVYDFSGAGGLDSSSPSNCNGTAAFFSGSVTGCTITPITPGAALLSEIQENEQTAGAVSITSGTVAFVPGCESSVGSIGAGSSACGANINIYSGAFFEQDQGDAYFQEGAAATTTETFTWTYIETDGAKNIGQWASTTLAIKPQSASEFSPWWFNLPSAGPSFAISILLGILIGVGYHVSRLKNESPELVHNSGYSSGSLGGHHPGATQSLLGPDTLEACRNTEGVYAVLVPTKNVYASKEESKWPDSTLILS